METHDEVLKNDRKRELRNIVISLTGVAAIFAVIIGLVLPYLKTNEAISIVKNGTSYAYQNDELTYGNVFGEYFDNASWGYKNDNGNNYVTFNGELKEIDGSSEDVYMEFSINDGEYMIESFTIDGSPVGMDKSYPILTGAFNKYMDNHGIVCEEVWPE